MAIYGSRTTLILYNSQSQKVEELTLLRMGKNERWIVTNPDLKIGLDAKLFSPALKAAYDHPEYMAIFEEYCMKGLSIRYSGAASLDVYQIFIKS